MVNPPNPPADLPPSGGQVEQLVGPLSGPKE